MTVIRVVLSLFVLLLVTISVAGWLWTTQHQAPAQAVASHIVLAASALAGGAGLFAVWTRARS